MFGTLLTAAAAFAAVTAVSAPAAASGPVYPEMYFEPVETVRDSRGRITSYRLCAVGDASFLYVVGAWDFRIDGWRATASGAPGPAITARDGKVDDPNYRNCLNAARFGYPTGHAHATFSYHGIGGNVPYTIEHTFTWCEGCPNPTALDLEEGVELEVDPL